MVDPSLTLCPSRTEGLAEKADHLRILVVCSKFPPALAPESPHAYLLCEQLTARGHDVHVVTTSGLGNGTTPFTVHTVVPDWNWRGLRTLLRTTWLVKPDAILLIYVGWMYEFHPMVTLYPLFARLIAPRARFVTQFENVQEVPGSEKTRLGRSFARRVLRRFGLSPQLGALLSASHDVVVLSERHLERLEEFWPSVKARSRLIPAPPLNRVSSDPTGRLGREGRQRLGAGAGDFVIGYFGYLYRSKGVETLIRAVASLRDSTIKVVLIGAMPHTDFREEIGKLVDELGVAAQLTFTGHCDPLTKDASAYLHAADLCVLPYDEGIRLNNSSFAVIAAHGRPVLSTRGAVLEPQFVHGENVWLCPSKNAEALAAAILDLRDRADLRAVLIDGVSQLAREVFAWGGIIDATVETLRRGSSPEAGR